MENKYKYLLLILMTTVMVSCLKAPVTLESSDVNSNQTVTPLPFTGIIVFIQDNDVYMTDSIRYKNPKRLTFSNTVPKSMVTLSYSRDKIAYKNNSGSTYPVIIDTNGTQLAALTSNNYVSAMSWSGDSKTLVMREGTNLSFYGPSLGVSLPYLSYNSGYYFGFAMSKNKDLAYSYNFTFSNTDYNKIDFFSPSITDKNNILPTTKYTARLQFSEDANSLLVANYGYGSESGIEQAYVYDFTYFTQNVVYNGDFLSPINDICFTADGQYVLYSYVSTVNDKYVLFYRGINNSTDKIVYNSTSPITSIDCR